MRRLPFQVEAPSGYHVYSVKQRTEEKFEFAAARAGEYKFCFSNNGPRHEKIDFEIHIGHRVLSHEEVAKDGECALHCLN